MKEKIEALKTGNKQIETQKFTLIEEGVKLRKNKTKQNKVIKKFVVIPFGKWAPGDIYPTVDWF